SRDLSQLTPHLPLVTWAPLRGVLPCHTSRLTRHSCCASTTLSSFHALFILSFPREQRQARSNQTIGAAKFPPLRHVPCRFRPLRSHHQEAERVWVSQACPSARSVRREVFLKRVASIEEPPDRAAAAGDPSLLHRRNPLVQRQIRSIGNQEIVARSGATALIVARTVSMCEPITSMVLRVDST